jgi:hypothetical protein
LAGIRVASFCEEEEEDDDDDDSRDAPDAINNKRNAKESEHEHNTGKGAVLMINVRVLYSYKLTRNYRSGPID